MNTKRLFILTLLVFTATLAISDCSEAQPAEITIKTEKFEDGKKDVIFYVDGEEVARQKKSKYGELLSSTGVIPDGIGKEYHPNGEIASVIPYKNGKIHGDAKTYYDDGQLAWEGKLIEGKNTGPSKSYHKNGKIKWQGTYEDGKLEGPVKGWYENGLLQLEAKFTGGQNEGISSHYYDNGKIKSEYLYENGKLNGISKHYYKNGRVKDEISYVDGKYEGAWKEYYDDGSLMMNATFEAGKRKESDYYGPPAGDYYKDLRGLYDLANEIVKTVTSAGDISHLTFKSWFDRWTRAYTRADAKYYDYQPDRDVPYIQLDSRDYLFHMDSKARMCESALYYDELQKKSAERYRSKGLSNTYSGKNKKKFRKDWNEFKQNLENLKKSIADRR